MTTPPTDQPVPPIFVDEHGDVSAFRSVSYAESWMEPIDIENREYTAYDASGRLLAISRIAVAFTFHSPSRNPLIRSRSRRRCDTFFVQSKIQSVMIRVTICPALFRILTVMLILDRSTRSHLTSG